MFSKFFNTEEFFRLFSPSYKIPLSLETNFSMFFENYSKDLQFQEDLILQKVLQNMI